MKLVVVQHLQRKSTEFLLVEPNMPLDYQV